MWGKHRKKDTYEKCITCATTEIRHKGNGLCLRCYDKNRLKNPKRVEQVKKIKDNWYKKNKTKPSYTLKLRYFQYLQKTKRSKKGTVIVIDGVQVQTPIKTTIKSKKATVANPYYASEIKAFIHCWKYLQLKKQNDKI
jgi:hypothetical protein